MSYQDRIDIDRLYDLVYDTQSEQLKVITREEFEQIVGSTRDLKDKMALYPDKSEVELEIFKILRDAGVITDDKYNELVGKIRIAQNTADRADDKATNAVGTADKAQKSAKNALDGVVRIDGEIGDVSTQGTIKYDVNQAKTQSSQAIQDSSDAKDDSSKALSKSEGALDLAETVDGKANQLRTDVGTVNQPNDGSLQQQITYLPSYISKLVVSGDGINWQNVAHLNQYGSGWIGVFPSELAYKQLRDDDYIEYTIEITDPDNNVSTYTDRITSYVTVSRMNYFDKNGIYIISCENLKCVVAVGDYTKEHTHPISQVTNLQTSLNGKANSTHSHPISDVDDLQLELNTKADLIHTHDISQVTNLQTSLDSKANSTHSHSISNITNLQSSLDAKQDKSNYSLIADVTSSSQTNGSVKLYSDGLDVLIQISGTFQNVNANGNTTIGTVTSSDYLPSMDYVISNNASIQADRQTKCWIRKSDGAVALSNGTSSTSITIYAIIRYPLASRMP